MSSSSTYVQGSCLLSRTFLRNVTEPLNQHLGTESSRYHFPDGLDNCVAVPTFGVEMSHRDAKRVVWTPSSTASAMILRAFSLRAEPMLLRAKQPSS